MEFCLFGSAFKKFTKLLSNFPEFSKLSIRCDRSLVHAVLAGTFLDAKQRSEVPKASFVYSYPGEWCRHYASLACTALARMPKEVLSALPEDSFHVTDFGTIAAEQYDRMLATA